MHPALTQAAPALSGEAVPAFCRRHHIRKLSLFGSILTPQFRPDSDIDVLIEFEAGCVPGYFNLAGMELELSAMLGRKVCARRKISADIFETAL